MTTFSSHEDEIVFSVIEGHIIDQKSEFETHVQSHGGGGFVGKDGGYVAPPKIESSTTHHQQVWMKTVDGKEKCLNLKNFKLNMRSSHSIKVLMGKVSSSNFEYVAGIKNLSTDECDIQPALIELYKNSKIFKKRRNFLNWAFIGVVLGSIPMFLADKAGMPTEQTVLFWLVGAVLGGMFAINRNIGVNQSANSYEKKVAELTNQI
ncbi:hypothetical protein VCSRO151_3517 [Vibrio cholerae]|uniref:hypothetical protein n=1 Tax=Vibrio cholerae TaxID=666 RepID=UPI0011D97831|nr:hypothetical protein [Vibrio cholerae]TXX95395.1 hypothetical protein FXF11_01715 [Vibrio cholerae]GHW46127.1 hypothetical protein VCSRO151_3517 [Vibrio cholerae]